MQDKVLEITGLRKNRGAACVLDDVSLSVTAGERVALLGHNGAGKSTLIKAVLGLMPFEQGEVLVAGHKPGSAAARSATAFLPEAVSFHPALTGREQLHLFSQLAGVKADIEGLLDRVGLADALDRRIGTYSKGMRQRLGLAQVLLGKPQLALLDEPTSGLDPISRQDLYEIIDELAAAGCAVLIASHALTEVEARTDRIAILRKGKLVANDTLVGLSAQAGLRTRVRLKAGQSAADLAALTGGRQVNGASVEIEIEPPQKMQTLQRIAALGDAVVDVDITPPDLEELYRHYAREGLQ